MLAQVVIGIIVSLLLLFILGGLLEVYEHIEASYKRMVSIQGITLKIIVSAIGMPEEEIPNISQCAKCFDSGGLCQEHEKQAREVMNKMEELK